MRALVNLGLEQPPESEQGRGLVSSQCVGLDSSDEEPIYQIEAI